MACGVPYFEFDGSVREVGFLSEEGGWGSKGVSDVMKELVNSIQCRSRGRSSPPMVGSLFSWKSLFTNLRTSDDWMNDHESVRQAVNLAGSIVEMR